MKSACVDSISVSSSKSNAKQVFKMPHFTMHNLKAVLGLQFDFRSSQKVKLTWQKYIPMMKW